jgi:lipoprotein-anchoring transpeptidase ErfK/SrfK
MVSSVDGLAGAAVVGSSGAAAASRSCVGGGNRGLGGAGPRLYAGRTGRPPPDIALLTTLGICCTAPKSRSKATIRVIHVDSGVSGLCPVTPLIATAERTSPDVSNVPILLPNSRHPLGHLHWIDATADRHLIESGMTNRFATAQSTEAKGRWKSPAIVTLAAVAALTALTADATAQRARPASQPKETVAPRDAGEPIMAVVSIKSQQVTFYDADGWILRAPVSTGTKERETPAGVFAVVDKEVDHRSNMYDDAWMPHMQRITWNGIALHGGPLPGYAASHGCVRMPFGFAEKLYGKTRIGMRVIISPNDAEPVEFSHPALFMPRADAIAAAPARAETLAREAAEAAKAADPAKKAAAAAAREAASLTASLRKLELLKTRADAELASADKALAVAKTDQAKAGAEERRQKAASRAEEAAKQLDIATADAKSKPDASAAKDALKAAEAKKAATAKAALDAKLAVVPVSIYISRATQKLYVRRNTHKPWPDGGEVFDSSIEVPVTIRNPEKRIGTHVFTAMARGDAGLRWSAVTIDDGDDAKGALDRIAIPQDVLDRIAPTALPRSSIIISDEPLSKETNYRTEFVAVLSNQPQGGFITRKPTEVRVADDNGFSFFRSWDSGDTRQRGSNPRVQPGWRW